MATAEVIDRKGALLALKRCKPLLRRVQSLLCDGGYTGQPFAQGVQEILDERVTVQIAKRSELRIFHQSTYLCQNVRDKCFGLRAVNKTSGIEARFVAGPSPYSCTVEGTLKNLIFGKSPH